MIRHSQDNPANIQRFKREMKLVGQMDHPNIVRATDARRVADHLFLVMEYVPGLTLAELRRRTPIAVHDACELTRQTALGLTMHTNTASCIVT